MPPQDKVLAKRWKTLTISGIVLDQAYQRLTGVNVVLYRITLGNSLEPFAETRTDAAGLYRFSDVPQIQTGIAGSETSYAVVASAPGRSSQIEPVIPSYRIVIPFRLVRPVTVSGRVIDPEGLPVKGVQIWDGYWEGPVAGVFSAVTNADGQFSMDDLPPLDADGHGEPRKLRQNTDPARIPRLLVRHPDFADQRLELPRAPATIEIKLTRGGQIRGKVVDTVTGKPAGEITVTIQPTKQSMGTANPHSRRVTRTNADGEYQFQKLAAADYNVWADADGRTCAALNSIPIAANATHMAATLELVEGSWLEGRVLSLKGQPVTHDSQSGDRLRVAVDGAARPRSGVSFESCSVNDDGSFRLRVPPGRNFPYLLAPGTWLRTWRIEKFERGLEVEAGKTLAVNFRILLLPSRSPPSPRPERDPVRLPLPVVEERDVAETIRDLGGWYRLDDDRHVVEINMVSHEADSVRHRNSYVDSDQALRIAAAFPRLKQLQLHNGQATDESMSSLAELQELERLFVWNATGVTDSGAKRFAQLKKLTRIHFSGSNIGDGALQSLSTLPKLSEMSLQGNNFTDAGLAHLLNMRQLRSLSIGMSKGEITDAGLVHLAGLENLEELDLQQCAITDRGLVHLKQLTNLLRLNIGPGNVTDKGVAELQKVLPQLRIQ
jgi:hypothetical protein